MAPNEDDILDPAHRDDGGVENAGAAGVTKPDDEKKDEAPEIKVSDDGNVAEYKGTKFVRQEALHQERAERQRLAKILADLDPLMPEFEQFVKTKTNRQNTARDAAAAGGEKDDDEYLQEVASALGFYTETNEPDVRRAQAHLNITRREAQRAARREVEPVAASSQRERAAANRERVRAATFVDGQPIADKKYIEAALEALPDGYVADQNIANLVQIIAAGLEHLDQRRNGTAGRRTTRTNREPMYVEGSSGRFDGDDGEMSSLDIAAARARGKTPEQWAKLTKAVNTKRGATLEEV